MLWLIGGIVMAAVVTVMFLRGRPSASASPVPANPRIFAPLIRSGSAFYTPTIIAKGLLLPPMIQSASVFYSPTVLKGETVSPPLVASGSAFYAPSINQNLVAPLVASASQFYAATVVTTSGQALVVPLVASASQFYGPKVNQNLAVPMVASGSVFYGVGLFTGSTPGSLSTPSVSLTSAAGEPPAVDITMGADIYAGFYLRIQRSADGARNVSDGSYANATLNILHQVSPPEVAALAITNTDLAFDGYTNPTGTWYQQYRWEREDGAISAWSSEITGTVTVSTAQWHTVTGTNKSQYVTSTGFTAFSNNNVGAVCGVRSTVEMVNDKGHAELTVNDLCASSGKITFGVTNATQNLTSTTTQPGTGSAPGCSLQIATGSSSATLGRNGATQSLSIGAAPAAGDIISADLNRLTNVVTFKYYRLATASVVATASVTMTSNIPADWHLFAGFNKRLSATDRDDGTTNFGADPFTVPPLTGHDIYG